MLLDYEGGYEMPEPDITEFPTNIREVFKLLQNTINKDDLISLQTGENGEERLINVYFKILEKVNKVLQRASDYVK